LTATIAAGTLSGIEALSVNGRFATDPNARPSYELVLENGNAASGARLIVNGSSLAAEQSFGFDGSRVADALLTIFGGAGSDRLTGGANGDVLYAGGGADLLAGGGGADVFQYRSASESSGMATDRIADFVSGTDRIDLAQIDANSAAAGDQAFAFVGSAAFSGVAGQLRAAFVGPNLWRVEGDVNGDFEADFVLEIVGEAGQPLGASDFVL
ncbi:MAG TPA: M10 family metallopeptidase C-terminal domain-containing protein, partial [Allosphingosinicella sp.]